MNKSIVLFLAFSISSLFLYAQEGQSLSMADAILKGRGALAPAGLGQLQWIPGTDDFSHTADTRLVRVHAPDLRTDTLDVLPAINAALAARSEAPVNGLPPITWVDAQSFWFHTATNAYVWNGTTGVQWKNDLPAEAVNVDFHEKTCNAAFTASDALRVRINGAEQTVAKSEAEGIVYGKSVHRDEFGIFKGTFWNTSGNQLAFYRMDESMVTPYNIYVLDSMPAQTRSIRYPYAGAKSHHVTIGVYDTRTQKTVYLQTGEPAEQYLTNVAWTPDDRYILVAVVNRAQNHCWLNLYDASTGAFVRTILEETNDRWVEPENPPVFVPGKNDEFLWQSERDGYNRLYLYDLKGKLIQTIGVAENSIVRFRGFDKAGKHCFYEQTRENGLERYGCTTELYKPNGSFHLNPQGGIQSTLVNESGKWVLTTVSNLNTPLDVYASPFKEPQKRKIYYSAPNPIKDIALGQTRMVTITGPDGTPLNARLILPTNFDPAKRYPAIVYVYNGPHVQLVTNSWLAGGELWMHRMAQLGYVTFSLDGRGSANRGFAFESAVHRRLGDAEVADQLAGVAFLKSQGFIDTARLGVYGWSYGGFMTTSLMSRPESAGVFKCGVAGGPVIDWRMYEIMYTERYMDTPRENPEGYDKNSLFKYVDNLQGRLLMIHGSSDDVVLWQHSLRYIRECVRKGKQIDYFVYPEHLHNVRGKDRVHLFEKIERFFVENL
ncbi:MAG: DPP IV N-terminal domain-containing protein [Saprospiraceae bacterium]